MEAPRSLQVRRATGADAHDVAVVHIASWQSAYRGMLPDEFLDGLDVDQRASLYTFDSDRPEDPVTWIAVSANEVVGFVSASRCRDNDADGLGEIQALYVAPHRWRSGAGAVLLKKGESLLKEMDFAEASLWVLEANERARRFYEAVGWRLDACTNTLTLAGEDVVEVRYRKVLN
jgi:ribosomal protein S18 acetylase RimI-like enzyme